MNGEESDKQRPKLWQIGLVTAAVALLLTGVVELIALLSSANSYSASDEPTAFGPWTLVWVAVYLPAAMGNSWWIGRFLNLPPVGWLSGICTHFVGSVLIAPYSAVIAILLDNGTSFLTAFGEGGIVALLISPVTAVAVALGEVLRHLSLKGKIWSSAVTAAGVIVWLLALFL